jgi:hypothetical protein
MSGMNYAMPILVLVALAVAGCASTPAAGTADESTTPPPAGPPTPQPTVGETATMAASATPETGLGETETCANDELRYAVSYLADWWVNASIEPNDPNLDPIAACQYFAPDEVDLQPNAGLPGGLAIWFETRDEELRPGGTILSEETVMVAGREATRIEFAPEPQAGFIPEGSHVYVYVLEHLGGQLVGQTDDIHQDEAAYEQSRKILDSMMETLDLQDT